MFHQEAPPSIAYRDRQGAGNGKLPNALNFALGNAAIGKAIDAWQG